MAGKLASLRPYTIVSNDVDKTTPVGLTYLTGTVTNEAGVAQTNALVATTDFKHQTTTDSLGQYSIYINEADTAFFVFQTEHEEVVMKFDFESQHHMVVNFRLRPNAAQTIYFKPVIYCYADEPTSINLQMDFKADLTFTYPKYPKTGWNVTTTDKGTLIENGKEYPYLFWEAENDHPLFKRDYFMTMTQVKTDTIVTYFERCLSAMGFNEKEKTDFITFWGPKVSATPYALVHFMTTKAYGETIAELNCTPKPETLIRTYLLFTPLNEPIPGYLYYPESFKKTERKGLTVVEWGGSIVAIDSKHRIELR